MAKIRANAPGQSTPFVGIFPDPIISNRAPTVNDKKEVTPGQLWLNQLTDTLYVLSKVTAGAATWIVLGGPGADVNTLTGDTGGAIAPAAGNINLLGTANEITSAGAGSTITFSFVPNVIFTQGDVAITRAAVGAPTRLTITNTDNTNAASHGEIQLRPGGPLGGDSKVTFFNNVTGSSTEQYGIGLDNDNSDFFVMSNSNNLGTNDFFIFDPTLMTSTFPLGDVIVTRADSGGNVDINISNSGAAANSNAVLNISTLSAASNSFITYQCLNSAVDWAAGQVEATNEWVIANGSTLTSNPAFRVQDTTRDVQVVGGHFELLGAARQIRATGGAATDFIGTATLVAGTVTVLNTNIAATDRILVVRSTTGGTEGHLSYVINVGVSFVINSSSAADTSTVVYFIVREL